MAGAIKDLMIGLALMCGILLGGLAFISNGYINYSVDTNATTFLNNTQGYLDQLGSTSSTWQGYVQADSFQFGVLSLIGLVFLSLGEFVINVFNLGGLLTAVVGNLMGASAIIAIPAWVPTIIGIVVTVVITISAIGIVISRSSEDL